MKAKVAATYWTISRNWKSKGKNDVQNCKERRMPK